MYPFLLNLCSMRTIIILLIFFFSSSINAQIKVEGYIYDKDSEDPLEGITVIFINSQEESAVFTDEKGKFITELDKDKNFEIFITSLYTEDYQSSFISEKD